MYVLRCISLSVGTRARIKRKIYVYVLELRYMLIIQTAQEIMKIKELRSLVDFHEIRKCQLH